MALKEEAVLTVDTMNSNVKEMQYAVRGPIVGLAAEVESELENGQDKPFKEVVRANIGDCHATGQHPLTFLRQVLALTVYPDLFKDPNFPEDAKLRANLVLDSCKGRSVGSYSESSGLKNVRKHIAEFIERRDGYQADMNHVFTSTGASEGIKTILHLLNCDIDGKKPGVMIPIPQYPLYSATLVEYAMPQIQYYLDEENHWSLDMAEMQRAIDEARSTCNPRAVVVINPGNPTGQVLSRQNIESIIKFAHKERLVILADEVYQHNVYDPACEFHSFKKVLTEMGPEISANVQLASFMSISKGYMGECGLRAGYFEVVNFDEKLLMQLNKCISVKLCPPVTGQAALECVVNPPREGEPSYELHEKEKAEVLDGLKAKAKLVSSTFNAIDGISCNNIQGAMYCFPQVQIPKKAIEYTQSNLYKVGVDEIKITPDEFYCFELLKKTGLCVVPGSGFKQREGTYHFRCTILPEKEKFDVVMEKFKKFHTEFLAEWQ
ncbi:alanine aminotransferase 1-like [Watersipora subatra]|uniref:alanine aminotransferase 1-like n=1 Tax=Watersipora subatra TaxID=2589382 RepID=UPI00355BB371